MSETPTDSTANQLPVKKGGLPKRTVLIASLLGIAGLFAAVTTLKKVLTPVAVETAAPAPEAMPIPSAPLHAAAGPAGGALEEWQKRPAVQGVFPQPANATPEQIAKGNEVKNRLGPLVWTAMEKFERTLSDPQKKARVKTAQIIQDRQLKGLQAQEMMTEAMNLSAEQKVIRMDMIAVRDSARDEYFKALSDAKPAAEKPADPQPAASGH